MKTCKTLISTILLFGTSLVPAYADTFTVTDNLIDGQSLSSGSTARSLFYVANLFPEEPFVINRAYFTFYMSSTSSSTFVNSQETTTTAITDTDITGDTIESTIFTENFYESGKDVQVQLSIGSFSNSYGSVYIGTSTRGVSSYEERTCSGGYIGNNCLGDLQIDTYIEQETSTRYSVMDTAGFLSGTDVASLYSTGLIFWNLGVTGGSLSFSSAYLTVDYDLIPSNPPVASVPEASSAWLLTFGLLGLFGAARCKV